MYFCLVSKHQSYTTDDSQKFTVWSMRGLLSTVENSGPSQSLLQVAEVIFQNAEVEGPGSEQVCMAEPRRSATLNSIPSVYSHTKYCDGRACGLLSLIMVLQ